MEVDKSQYPKQLLSILKHIANASFITFDLEMSGITMRPKHGFATVQAAGKSSLQQQYLETKTAAETFQILEVGITCVEEDREKAMYVARPYNFYLNPLFLHADRLNIERKVSFSSSACDFLLNHGFNFGNVFERGVPYLSQEEEQHCRDRFAERMAKPEKKDVILSPAEPETLEFYRSARKTISAWINEKKPKLTFVNISSPDGPLNGYQRRLVHQLVANEFPEYRTFARNDKSFMQIEKIDEKKEAEFQRKKSVEFEHMVAKQIGLRWIFEAICGGDLSGIDPWWFAEDDKPATKKALDAEFQGVIKALQSKKHVIVGHNLFTDLIFLYKTFMGKLPPHVRDFQKRIHTLFPIVIDTKYLATHGTDSMGPREGLKALWEPFKMVHLPFVALEENHMAYGAAYGKDHEAGYDSWMTADLFIKLSAKINNEQKTLLEEEDAYDDASSDASSELIGEYKTDEDRGPGGVPLYQPDTDGFYARLMAADPDYTAPAAWHAARLNPYPHGSNGHSPTNGNIMGSGTVDQWIPNFDSAFWEPYINKLRVNSVESGLCRLSMVDEE